MVLALLGVLLVERIVLHHRLKDADVDLTSDDLGVDHLAVLDDGADDVLKVGQLVALRVDLPVIRIACVRAA
jgi:hypothetical protein